MTFLWCFELSALGVALLLECRSVSYIIFPDSVFFFLHFRYCNNRVIKFSPDGKKVLLMITNEKLQGLGGSTLLSKDL